MTRNTTKIGNTKLKLSLIVILILIIICLFQQRNQLEQFNEDTRIPKMERPFLNIYDDKGNKINVVFITHPFTRSDLITKYEDAKKRGIHFIGMSSYSEFPGIITNPHDPLHKPDNDAWTKYNYYQLTEGWCHCFRNPELYITDPDIPQALISESDFLDYNKHLPDPSIEKKYDFVYICLKDNDKCNDGWQAYNRNWTVARKCLDIMCNKYNLKGLLVGRINCEIPSGCHNLMELTDKMVYADFIKVYNQSKFIFVPNITDASPRVMTEAMCYNLPILVNYNIVGGWKYVNYKTGEFFKDENDFENVLSVFLNNMKNNEYHPRQYFIDNYGPHNAGTKLLNFITECIPEEKLNFNKSDVQYLKPGI